MTNEDQWLMRIAGALSAHFFQPDGSSRPGTDWSVELKQGERVYHVMVRAYLSEDMTKRARGDMEYQGQTVLGYVSDLLAQGWTPEQGGELGITIQNPDGEEESAAGKPWWKFW
ncbi:MAG TPA: hypothetical protein VGW12_03835 [Pyrinomonadaceae bacterium]|nr:hypothetical protein [Pyrinomonadaceae bacterium]